MTPPSWRACRRPRRRRDYVQRHLPPDREQVLRRLDTREFGEALVLSQDRGLGYLALTYTPLRPPG